MGASQSKKRRKDKRKRKKFSPCQEIPRSASVDAIRALSVPSSLSSCTHCQHSLSWSESVNLGWEHQPPCLQRQYEEIRINGSGFESCPDCYSKCLQHGQPASSPEMMAKSASEDRCESSTMSLNRNIPRHSTKICRNNTEFSQLKEIIDRQKERKLMPQCDILLHRPSPPLPLPQQLKTSTSTDSATVSIDPSSSVLTNALISETPSSQPVTDNNIFVKDTKLNVLDDEESNVSRSVKRKQMAQQLRDLRKHLEKEESSQQPSPFVSTSDEKISGAENDSQPFKLHSHHSTNIDSTRLQTEAPIAEPSSSSHTDPLTASPTRRTTRSKFSRMSNYRYLDNHPVLTKLQNEQNNRLESMERRMKEIRISAMQEAERRKFAEIFPAKNNDTETQRMLEEAKETLEKLKEEKRKKARSSKSQQSIFNPPGQMKETSQVEDGFVVKENLSSAVPDAGDIIPVCVVPPRDFKSSRSKFHGIIEGDENSKEADKNRSKPFWFKDSWLEINLYQPLTWLLLPFLLFPLILRLLLWFIVNTSTRTLNEAANGNSNNVNCGSDDGSGQRSSDSHQGLSRLRRKKSS